MVRNMKTTLNLPDDVMAAVRAKAAEQGTTMTAVVLSALRQAMTQRTGTPYHIELPTTRGHRMPALDVDSNSAIDEYFDRAKFADTE